MLFKNKKICLGLIVLLSSFFSFAETKGSGVERFAVYIGCNSGGKNNARLMYAGTDATSFQKTMTEIGGVPNSNSILLIDPTKDDVDNALNAISDAISRNANANRRSEFIFYYSGHSSETALLLGKTSYDYSLLKESITKVPSDVHVVILDSCYSGNFIRTKGGSRQKPFLVDDSTVVKGHAYLSSSSSQEASQESDEIGSSFFTNAVLTGLRGAADTTGDKKVTLNELYSYAFNETLSKTESSASGPQHPNYNITLVGSGDLVLSDISTSECLVKVSKETDGRVIIRNNAGKLVSEIKKSYGNPVYLALERGRYSATIITQDTTYQGNFDLSPSKVYVVETNSLNAINRSSNRTRGGNDDGIETADMIEQPEDESAYVPFTFSIVGNEFTKFSNKAIISTVAIGLIRSDLYEIRGVQCSTIGNQAENVSGGQEAGLFNITKNLKGEQGAGIFNIAQSALGAQCSGIFNLVDDMLGAQCTGIFNIADDMQGFQGAGVFNASRGILGAQCAGVLNVSTDTVGFQGAGVGNLTFRNVKGVQAAGVFNYAAAVRGVQVGLVNVCSGNVDGAQIGLINISRNGVCEVGASYSTENKIRTTFNTGNKYCYFVLGYFANAENAFDWPKDNWGLEGTTFGLGSRYSFWKFNFDFEVLGNTVYYVENKHETNTKIYKAYTYPSVRASAGFTPIKHLNFFAGFTWALEFDEVKPAFENMHNNWVIECGDINFHPEFDFGVRFSLN